MARLNDHQLVHRLDDGDLVITDESTGEEIVVAPVDVVMLYRIIAYLLDGG